MASNTSSAAAWVRRLRRLACGDTDPARQERVRQALLDAVAGWMR